MHIKIASRFRPYTHDVGTICLIPKASWSVQVFPACLRFFDLKKGATIEKDVHLEGPIRNFTALIDWEKGHVTVFGISMQGYFRYRISHEEKEIVLTMEKVPPRGITIDKCTLFAKEYITIPTDEPLMKPSSFERIHFGNHKAQEWEKVKRRADISEIFPLWYHASQLLPSQYEEKRDTPMFQLLAKCQEVIAMNERHAISQAFLNLFDAGFDGIFAPRLIDIGHRGLIENPPAVDGISPLPILKESGEMIRELFVKEEKGKIYLLPCLPLELHAGRFLGVKIGKTLLLDFEWTKKIIRRLILRPFADQEIYFVFQSKVKDFRLRTHIGQKGKILSTIEPITVKKDQIYFLDHFQK